MSCGFTASGKQCNECPLYAKWEKIKKSAYDVKITVSLENHKNYFMNFESTANYDYKNAENKLHALMKINLSDKHFFIYKQIKNKSYGKVLRSYSRSRSRRCKR